MSFAVLQHRRKAFRTGGGADYPTTVLADSPLAYWRLGEASGNQSIDEMGSFNAAYEPTWGGLFTGGTQGVTGAIAGDADTSVTFNGTDGFCLSNVVSVSMNDSELSIDGWFYRSASNKICCVGTLDVLITMIGIIVYTDGNIYAYASDGADYRYAAFPFSGAGWHHFAYVFDGSLSGNGNRLKLYIDGSPITASSFSGTVGTTVHYGFKNFCIGRANVGPYFTDGGHDDIALYNTALTAGQVAAHYAAGI